MTTHAIPAAAVVATWERAYRLGPVEKALLMYSLIRPGESLEQLSESSIGQSDLELLKLRGMLFGPEIQCLDACAECGTEMEITFAIPDIIMPANGDQVRTRTLELNGRRIQVRALSSRDLLSITGLAGGGERRIALLQRCISPLESEASAASPGSTVAAWDESQTALVAQTLAEIDPQADVRVAMECDHCGKKWSARFDITSFLWREINAWVQRLLAEVHGLAAAYGWSESSILGMSSWRRQIYLGMLRR